MKFRILLYCIFSLAVLGWLFSAPTLDHGILAFSAIFAVGAALTSIDRARLAACPSPFDALRIATENLPDDIHQRSVWHSLWLNYVPRLDFPMNSGTAQTTFVMGNSEPSTNAETWTEITQANNVVATMCSPSFVDADVGYNEYTYRPRKFSLRGPVICRETLSVAHNPAQFIAGYVKKLGHRSKRSIEYQFRNAYTAIADKAVCRLDGLNILQGSTTFQQLAAQSQLTWDFLDDAARILIENGATSADQDMIEMGPDGPLFLLEIGLSMKQKLFTNVSEKRSDVRFAQEGMDDQNLLFRRIGATDTHKNFRIAPELYPSRYTFANGIGYTEVPTWEMVSSSEGTVARLTAAWKNAPFEAARIVTKSVMNARVWKPDSAGLDWEPTNFMLDWIWKTGGDISETYCFDPFKDYGRHFARMTYAPEAVFPDYGLTIIFSRCGRDITTAACTNS